MIALTILHGFYSEPEIVSESSATAHWKLEYDQKTKIIRSVDHLLQPLHGQSTDSLGSRLGLEHARLFCEWIDLDRMGAC
jgi:hypothetical protein